MSWNTLYISGKVGFKEKVLESLEDSDLSIMPGSTGNEQDVLLIWIDDTLSLRSFKKAIGSKLIFKYRLHFYDNLEARQQTKNPNNALTPKEEAMIRKMNDWENHQNYLHSA